MKNSSNNKFMNKEGQLFDSKEMLQEARTSAKGEYEKLTQKNFEELSPADRAISVLEQCNQLEKKGWERI